MMRIMQTKDTARSEFHHLFRQREHGRHAEVVSVLDLNTNSLLVRVRQRFVNDQEHSRYIELSGDINDNGRPLEILLIRTQNDDRGVRKREREQGLFIETRVRIQEQKVEIEIVD